MRVCARARDVHTRACHPQTRTLVGINYNRHAGLDELVLRYLSGSSEAPTTKNAQKVTQRHTYRGVGGGHHHDGHLARSLFIEEAAELNNLVLFCGNGN